MQDQEVDMVETPKRPEPQSRTVTPFVFMDNSRPASSAHPAGGSPSFRDFVASKAAAAFQDDVPDVDDAGIEDLD